MNDTETTPKPVSSEPVVSPRTPSEKQNPEILPSSDSGSELLSSQASVEPESKTRARRSKPRTSIPESQEPSAAAWSPEHARRLLAQGRDLLVEDESFLHYHRTHGTLSACWNSSRARWVLGAEKGFGAPRQQALTPYRRNDVDENQQRQLRRVKELRARELQGAG